MTTPTRPVELKIGQPQAFDGDRTKTERFISDCKLYLRINQKVYDDPEKQVDQEKQVGFILSFMSEGTAAIWKEDYLEQIFDPTNTVDFPRTTEELYRKIIDFFQPINATASAISAICKLAQKGTAEQYVADFQTLLARTKDTQLETQRKWFLDGLRSGLRARVASETIGKTKIDEYYQVVIVLDQIYKDYSGDRENSGRSGRYRTPFRRNIRASNNDPNTHQRLSDEERTRYLREGRCFTCHQTRHIATQCPNRENRNPGRGRPNRVGQIRAMMQGLSAEERLELAEEAQNAAPAQPTNIAQNF
ncbi:hypothetical protein EUX98_g1827 [Antrodiella citrinella]|uniref:CCHC-type domain-containing protein n=1 Tax=Antrodiella citrinella TaxID=2447956 RepID=A0A4S4N8W2_9APHY|nr:hypothetical protein EUX98_g1827 [Antrodiella citrinella]